MRPFARAALVFLGAAFVMTLLGTGVAARSGQFGPWHAVAIVAQAGAMCAVAVGSWMARRPWRLERAPRALSLADLHIVPRYYFDRLASMGIFTVTALRRAGADKVAHGIGATPDMVRRWQARAELHLLEVREEVLGWAPAPEERWPAIAPGTGAFGRGHSAVDEG